MSERAVVAVVEDNEDNMMLVRALLEDRFEIHGYVDGPSALAGLPENVPNVVLLDISLPGMSGIDVLARLREDDRVAHLPVVALTAHAMAGDRDRFLEAGFDGYISKPILDVSALWTAIDEALAKG